MQQITLNLTTQQLQQLNNLLYKAQYSKQMQQYITANTAQMLYTQLYAQTSTQTNV